MYKLLEDPLEQQSSSEPSLPGQIAKGALKTLPRVAEAIVGTPGNLLSTGFGALNYIGRKIGDENPIPTYEQIQEKLPISLPTSQQVRENVTQKLTGQELEPESDWENRYQQGVETFTNLLNPLNIAGKGTTAVTALKGALGGELFKYIAESFGLDDMTQAVAKTAGILSGTMGLRGKELARTYEKNYGKFGELAKGKKVPSKQLYNDIEKIYDQYVSKGDSSAKGFAKQRLKAIENTIEGNSIDAHDLWELKKNANEYFADASKSERDVLKKIIDAEKNALKQLGPDYKTLQEADDIYSSFMQSNSAMRTIKKVIPHAEDVVPWLKPLLGYGATLTNKLPHLAGGYGVYKIAKEANMARKFLGTETGRNFYKKILEEATLGATASLAKDIKKLNHEAKKFELLEDKPTYKLLED